MNRSLIGVVVGGLALLGCATPVVYGPMSAANSMGFGYTDLQNADGSYTVRTRGTTGPQAHEFMDRRAAELCGGPNYRKNIFRAEVPVYTYTGYASNGMGGGGSYTESRYAAPILEAYIHCEEAAAAETAAEQTAPAESVVQTTPQQQ